MLKTYGDKLNRSMSTLDFASMIREDASDTFNKYTEILNPFLEMYSVLDVKPGFIDADGMFDKLYDYIHDQCDDKLTLVMNDGDIIWLSTFYGGDSNFITNVYWQSGEETSHGILHKNRETGEITTDNLFVRTYNQSFNWSIDEVISSLSESVNASLLFSRLSTLCSSAEVSIADITASISGISVAAGSGLQRMIDNIKDLGTNINGITLGRILQLSYKTITETDTPSTDTIDWNTNDFSVTAFAGTVIKKVFATAVQAVGTILVFSTNIVVKIAGIVLTTGAYVLQKVWEGVTYVTGEHPKFKALSDTHEFPMPVYQETVRSGADFPEEFKYDLDEGYLLKISTNIINYYLWKADDEYRCEGYITTFSKGSPLWKYKYQQTIAGNPYDFSYVTNYSNLDGGGLWHKEFLFMNGQTASRKFGKADTEEFFPSALPTHMSENDMQWCLLKSLYAICCQLIVGEYVNWDVHGVIEYDSSTYFGCDRGNIDYRLTLDTNTSVSDHLMDFSSEDPSTALGARKIIHRFVWNCNDSLLFTDIDGFAGFLTNRSKYTENTEIPTWNVMINKIIPAIMNHTGSYVMFYNAANILADDISLNFNNAYRANQHGLSETIHNVSLYRPSSFRENYEITPPSIEPGTTLKVLLITAAVTTAIVATTITVRSLVRRSLRSTMATKYAQIEAAHAAEVENPTPENIKEFTKQVRKYNFIARLFGYSTLSFMSGWENGDGASSDALVGGTQSVLETLADQAADDTTLIGQTVGHATQSILGPTTTVTDPVSVLEVLKAIKPVD